MCKARSISFSKAEAQERPFYINLWPDDVHSPFFPPRDRRDDGQKRTLYHAVLDTMDEQLGVLFDHIRQNDRLRDNTLILLASDNGPEPGAGSAGRFRGHKGTLYEGGIRSPLIVWGPKFTAVQKRGARNETNVLSSIDLVPSLLAIAKIQTPAGVSFDGVEAGDVLLGKADKNRPQPLYWRRPPDRPGPPGEPFPDLAVRQGPWKLLVQFDGSRPQLYHIERDPIEKENLAEQHPEITARLRQDVLAWHQRIQSGL